MTTQEQYKKLSRLTYAVSAIFLIAGIVNGIAFFGFSKWVHGLNSIMFLTASFLEMRLAGNYSSRAKEIE